VTDPANRTTTFEHDSAGNLIRVLFPDGSARSFGYDGRHRMTAETDANLNTTARTYNFAGKVVSAALPDGSIRETSAAAIAGHVDPASGLGTEADPAPVVRPAGGVSTYTVGPFDENGDEIPEERTWTVEPGPLALASRIVAPDGLETVYERDAGGNLERVEFPSGHAVSRSFDAKGNVLTVTDETLGGTTTFTYDPVFNQIETITDADQETTEIDLDGNGNPTQITTPEGRVTAITYEARGLPERITDVFGTVTKLTYGPITGNLLSILQGENLDPSLQRLTEITPTVEGYVDLLTDAEGRSTDTDYDPAGRITTQLLPGNRTIAFDYDPNGNLTLLTPPRADPTTPSPTRRRISKRPTPRRSRARRSPHRRPSTPTTPAGRSRRSCAPTAARSASATIRREGSRPSPSSRAAGSLRTSTTNRRASSRASRARPGPLSPSPTRASSSTPSPGRAPSREAWPAPTRPQAGSTR
jgi:YD repeat-containing protein